MLASLPVPASDSDDPIPALIERGEYREAIAQMAQRHGPAVGRMCFTLLRSQDEAEEVAQETFLSAHKALAQFRGDGSVRAWLFGIARRQCARRLERQRRHLELVEESTAGAGNPELSARKLRRAAHLRSILTTLKPSERDAIVLRYSAGLSFQEVAGVMGITPAAARKRASRGLMRLRTTLRAEDVE
jgi:RNA polymerase sigma-70 factor (ECF subfamily)